MRSSLLDGTCYYLPGNVKLYCVIGSALSPENSGAITADNNQEHVSTEKPNVWLALLEDSDMTALDTTNTPMLGRETLPIGPHCLQLRVLVQSHSSQTRLH